MSEIMLARCNEKVMDEQTLNSMFRLRHEVFSGRLKWDVASEDGMERDIFDQCDPVYILMRNDAKTVGGCWRLLPTTGPYMLKDTFPQLLHGQPVPQHANIWELSRFALAKSENESKTFGLSEIPIRMLQKAIQFAKQQGIDSYVTVTTVAVERLMRKLGLVVHRFGPPIRIGDALTVACWFDIDSNTESMAFGRSTDLSEKAA